MTRLDDSDVIVNIGMKTQRPILAAYLSRSVVVAGNYRYLRIATDLQGRIDVVSVLAHELQHALEPDRRFHIAPRDSRGRRGIITLEPSAFYAQAVQSKTASAYTRRPEGESQDRR